jgi:outer membrane protein assembly factor BamB
VNPPEEFFRFIVLCLDRQTGRTLWERVACEEAPHEGHHRDHGYASASPVTDGEHLLVSFGSRGLFCYDLDGGLGWKKDLGQLFTRKSFVSVAVTACRERGLRCGKLGGCNEQR